MINKQSNMERTGVRPLAMSALHRTLGAELKATDLDFVELSRITCQPKAFFEIKTGLTTPLASWQRQAIVAIAAPRSVELPAYCTNVNEEHTQFLVRPLNRTAERRLLAMFTKKKHPDHYYRLPDNSVMMSIKCYQLMLMNIHGIDKVTQSPEEIEKMNSHTEKINLPVETPVDVKALLKDFNGTKT